MTKLFATAGIGMLSLILGVPAVVCAQNEKPPQQEEPKAEPRPEPKAEPKHQEPKPQKQEEMKPQKQEEMKPQKNEEPKQRPEDARQQEHHEQAHQGQERVERPAGRSAHIPDDRFRTHFGREHTVVIRQPVIVEGRPRFQFGGYWFVISDPWPVEWAYTDDCYVDYVDGEYFLFDLRHPGVRIALFVVE